MNSFAIKAEHLGKKYRIRHKSAEPYLALRDVLARSAKAPLRWAMSRINGSSNGSKPVDTIEEFWALKDLNFEISEGDVVGVIGRNGAGKSTLLKVFSRITEPTTGRVRVRGRIASLLEVGTGFHAELTGRENIFLNGAILGMTRREIIRKFDEIVAFAEIEKFLDTPVKRYSSGMYVRLAFAVAAHLEPEILIVDEVLAVGDAAFQKKCLGKMGDVAKQGRTVVFVSHDIGVINTLTRNCIYLQSGQIVASGKSQDIVELYLMSSLHVQNERASELESYRLKRKNDSPLKITGLGVNGGGAQSNILANLDIGAEFTIEIELDVINAVQMAVLSLTLKTSRGTNVAVLCSWDKDCQLFLDPGGHNLKAHVRNLALAPGHYFVDASVSQSPQTDAFDTILDYPLFSVVNSGQVTHWLDRPWGILHCDSVEWITSVSQSAR